MKTFISTRAKIFLFASILALSATGAAAFESGSTGADGAFNPAVDTELQLPPDGIFNFTSVNIPSDVVVTFAKNDTNTPVTILASSDVTIDGTIDLNGGDSTDVGAAGDGNLGDDGIPGTGGPGGFDGGRGGQPGATNEERRGGDGLGPGGGASSGSTYTTSGAGCSGAGGGFSSTGQGATGGGGCGAAGGSTYGTEAQLPLIGGSGGGGASGGLSFAGSGGGGGGGAILIAASGTVTVNGGILARGGNGGDTSGAERGGVGGGGSGGAIRILATTISGNGSIDARGGVDGGGAARDGGNGADGRIRLEAEIFNRTSGSNPSFSFASPGEVFVAGMPAIRISRVAGVDAPAAPTGNADIVLPESTPNPVLVEFESSNVPVGNTITLTAIPANAEPVSTLSDALAGTEASATASASIDLPSGPSVLQASVSFTVTASVGDGLSNFAMGERVERIRVDAVAGHGSETTFITVSGEEYTWPSNAVAMY